jgi:hypothetical protein
MYRKEARRRREVGDKAQQEIRARGKEKTGGGKGLPGKGARVYIYRTGPCLVHSKNQKVFKILRRRAWG